MTFSDANGRRQRIAAYGVCTNDAQQILLCRLSAHTPTPGSWTLPGGGIDFGEHPIDAVVRECQEETGLVVTVGSLLTVDSIARHIRVEDDGAPVEYHAVRIIYRVDVVGGVLRDETDNSTDRAAWHDLNQLTDIAHTDVARLGVELISRPSTQKGLS